jgi:primosomal protein N' (replication factor Y) (superfamily II helicase)
MWVQTWHPDHGLYTALRQHDYEVFANAQLKEREVAGMPPFAHMAVLRAEAKDAEAARSFLQAAAELAADLPDANAVMVYPPVPMSLARVANVERVQMLIESESRAALQRLLSTWLPALQGLRAQRKAPGQRILRWAIDVDPLTI